LEQHQHVRNGTGANMVESDTPTDDNQERTDFTLEEERQIQQVLAKDLLSTGSRGNEGKDHRSNT
jgi:hypothetical protein